jgi:lipoprotein NlpI
LRSFPWRRAPISLAVVWALLGVGLSAAAQSLDKTWIACLRQPARTDDLAAACTVVIDSTRATAAQRAAALNNRGADINFRGNAPEQARHDLDQAIALQPDLARLYNTRGFIRASAADAKGAVEDFSQAIRLDPLFAVAWGNRAEALIGLGRLDEALRDLNEAIRLAPAYAHPLYDPYALRANLKEARGDIKGAKADRRESLRLQGMSGPGKLTANVIGERTWEPWLIR